MTERRLIVAIPVSDEAERLPACLRALVHQTGHHRPEVLVLVNNSGDGSAAIARRFADCSPVPIRVEEVMLPPQDAHAGGARGLAMQLAADGAAIDDLLLTTDADGQVAPDWLDRTLRAIDEGADAVAGRVAVDPVEEALIPRHLRFADAQESDYAALLDAIEAHVDPNPADPMPRHAEHSGASIAVTVAAFRAAGGIPSMPVGEDRAFFNRLSHIDARIRHAPDVWVTVSGRTDGRAAGGMADTIRRRMIAPDLFLDNRLEPAADFLARIRLRRHLREFWMYLSAWDQRLISTLTHDLRLTPAFVEEALALPFFGAAWHAIEQQSPVLRHRRRVAASAVEHESEHACTILSELEPTAEKGIDPPATMMA